MLMQSNPTPQAQSVTISARTDRRPALFVSGFVPWNLETLSVGLGQRFMVMLEAACLQWGHVAVMLLSADPRAESFEARQDVVRLIHSRLDVPIDIRILRIQPGGERLPSRLRRAADYFRPPSPLFTLSRASLAALRRHASEVDPKAILAHRLTSFRALRMAGLVDQAPIYLDLDDIEHIAHLRSIRTPPFYPTKKLGAWHCLSLIREELKATRTCEKIFVCSRLDAVKMRKLNPVGRYVAAPNAVLAPAAAASTTHDMQGRNVLFVGALGYMPNVAGMEWFLENIWPGVLQRCPDARLLIAGKGGESLRVPAPLRSSIDILGFSPSLAPLYRQSRVSVCPLLSGGGTRIKIIEAAAHGTPVVATQVGAEGLEFVNDESILIRDEPESFAQALATLLLDDTAARTMAARAHRVFMDRYERRQVVSGLAGALSPAGGAPLPAI